MTDNTPRPSTPAPSEGLDRWTIAETIHVARIKLAWGNAWEQRVAKFPKTDHERKEVYPHNTIAEIELALACADAVIVSLRRPSHTQGAEAMREAIATEIELVFKPLIMGQCISDWSMKQLVDASAVAAERVLAAFLVPASADGWRPIEMAPGEPFQVEFYFGNMVMLDQHGKPADLPPYRDERRALGYWDGEAWHHCGTGHRAFEFHDTPREYLPTHYRRLPTPPAPKETGP